MGKWEVVVIGEFLKGLYEVNLYDHETSTLQNLVLTKEEIMNLRDHKDVISISFMSPTREDILG